jgi:hypothetical protein
MPADSADIRTRDTPKAETEGPAHLRARRLAGIALAAGVLVVACIAAYAVIRTAKIERLTAEVRRLEAQHDFGGARAKLQDLRNLGEKTSSLSAEIERASEIEQANSHPASAEEEPIATPATYSEDLYTKASKEIESGDYTAAEQDLESLNNVGEDNLHKEDVPVLMAKIKQYRAEDHRFNAAKGQAQSSDKGTLLNAEGAFDSIARGGGRHAAEARNLSTLVAGKIKTVAEAESKAAAASATSTRKARIDTLTASIRSLEGQHDFAGARSWLPELHTLDASASSSLSAEIDKAEKGFAASQRRVNCTVGQMARTKYTRPLKARQEMGQAFLDSYLELSAGTNCGLAADMLQGAPKGEVLLLVNIDTDGKVVDGRVLTGDAAAGARVLDAAKRSWRFNAPKVNNIPVKTSASVAVRIK